MYVASDIKGDLKIALIFGLIDETLFLVILVVVIFAFGMVFFTDAGDDFLHEGLMGQKRFKVLFYKMIGGKRRIVGKKKVSYDAQEIKYKKSTYEMPKFDNVLEFVQGKHPLYFLNIANATGFLWLKSEKVMESPVNVDVEQEKVAEKVITNSLKLTMNTQMGMAMIVLGIIAAAGVGGAFYMMYDGQSAKTQVAVDQMKLAQMNMSIMQLQAYIRSLTGQNVTVDNGGGIVVH